MKTMFTAAAAALLATTAVSISVPAAAQTAPGIGVVNLGEAVQRTNAYQAAMTQIQTTYAAQIQQAQTRRAAIQTELEPMVAAFQTAQQGPNPNQQALAQQYQAIQQKEQAGQAELNQILQPVALARSYVEEQIVARLEGAVDQVMAAKQLAIVLRPDSVVKTMPSANITQDVVNALNTLVATVNAVPPAGWQPGQNEAAAAQPAPAQSSGR